MMANGFFSSISYKPLVEDVGVLEDNYTSEFKKHSTKSRAASTLLKPVRMPELIRVTTNQSGSNSHRKKITLLPQKMNLADFADTPPAKVRKVQKTARKELFQPQKATANNFKNNYRKPTSTKNNLSKKVFTKKIPDQNDTLPLINIDEAEEDLLKNKCKYFNQPLKLQVNNLSRNKPTEGTFGAKGFKTGDGASPVTLPTPLKSALKRRLLPDKDVTHNNVSLCEFLELEKNCGVIQLDTSDVAMTPTSHRTEKNLVSCNDKELESFITKIKNDFETFKTYKTKIDNIYNSLQTTMTEFEQFYKEHLQTLEKFESAIATNNGFKSVKKLSFDNKENSVLRRSARLSQAKRSAAKSVNKSRTPLGEKVHDQVPTASKSVTFNIASPSVDKTLQTAVKLYNSMRGDFAILRTPKQTRKDLNTPRSSIKSDVLLSRRIQRQCLRLHEDSPN